MNERISTLGQEGLAEACYELEPHSPTTSQSSWSTENAGSSSGICKAPRRKGSQCRLRAWIAIDRNANRFISDEQRRACPMIGCEQRFPAPEYMHLHLKSCGSLSKGLYRCIETGVPVKVGKCDSDGCQELKGGFVSAVSSSFESVKRHLSGRRSKPKQASQLYLEKEFVPEESFPMETPWDANTAHQEPTPRDHEYLVETSPGIRGASMTNNELEAYAAPSELYSTPISTYRLTHPVHRELFTSLESYENNTTAGFEQGGFRDAITQDTRDVHYVLPVLQRHNNPPSHLAVHSEYQDLSESSLLETMLDQTGPAELCAGERPWGHPRPHATDSTWSLSSPVGRGDFGGFHTCSDIMAIPAWQHQHEHHPNQSTAPPLSFYYDSEKMVDDNISTHDADDLARLACNSLARSTRNDSASNSDPSVVPSMFSSFSSTSSGQSSLASYNSNPSSFDHTSFLGKDSMIFDEPESFESFPMSSSQEQAYRSDISSNARRSDTAGVSFDNYVKPGSYLSNPAMNNNQLTDRLHIIKRQARPRPPLAPRFSKSLPNGASIKVPSQASASNSVSTPLTSLVPTPSSSEALSHGKAHCRHCGLTCDMSNRSRHERTCKQNPDVANVPRISCHHPGCTSTFNRKDNLVQHQRSQNHFAFANVELKISLTPSLGSPAWDWAMQALEQQQDNGAVPVQGDELRMDSDDGMVE